MIVKLRVDGLYNLCWEFISDVTSFRFSRITKEQAEEKSGDKNSYLNDFIQWRNKKNEVEEDVQNYIYFQAWHKRSIEPINIITNMPVFILNDEGKTIEKIN